MAMEVDQVESVGHDHPLMLIKPEETDNSWDLSCYGCQQPISASTSYYGCKRCMFFLHKSCAKLPPQMTHPSQPQHPLTFLPNPRSRSITCDSCEDRCNRFTYHCSPCNYDIDLKCALVVLSSQHSIKHTSHPHQLIPLQKESMFLCDACGIEHKGTSFLCTTCGFWINQKCAESPLNLKLNNHPDHTLSLIYIITQDFDTFCQICSKRMWRRNWAYSCSKCNYLVHFACAVKNKTENGSHESSLNQISLSSRDSTTAILDSDLYKVIHLPVPDDAAAADIITQFIKNAAIHGKHKEAAEIRNVRHPHPLTLFKEPTDHALSPLSGARNVGKCFGCTQSISAPFYGCDRCEYFLHVWCAELPDELQHPGHPQHTLSLSKYCRKCDCCRLRGNVIYYWCEQCEFFLDCKCASLPRVIKHESHNEHTLALRSTSLSGTCKSCSASLRISFGCGGCKFDLCVRCAILPHTVQHRYDKHPFILTYSRLLHQTEDDFCEICEKGIDSNRWFYHCGECNQYLHTDCILPVDPCSNMVYQRRYTIDTRKHQHRLISVRPNPNTWCNLCKRNNADADFYTCPPCKFDLCLPRQQKEIEGEI